MSLIRLRSKFLRKANLREGILSTMYPRGGREFQAWLADLLENDKQEVAAALADDAQRIDYFDDFLRDNQIVVREDGLIDFDEASDLAERLIDDLPVVVYHYTSDKILKKVKKEGLRSDVKSVNPYQNSKAGVCVTTECSGAAVNGYRNCARNGHGGNDIGLAIKTHLWALQPDPDDEDLSCGGRQFILPYVPPADILWNDIS